MMCNIHPVERVVRAVVGLGILALVFVGPKTLWGLVGVVPLLTGLTGFCPSLAFGLFQSRHAWGRGAGHAAGRA